MPLPSSIEEEDFQILSAGLAESDRRLAADWYRRDTNVVPPVRWLRARTAAEEGSSTWRSVETHLHDVLAQAAERLPATRRAPFLESAVEQEVGAGVLCHPTDAVGAYAVFVSGRTDDEAVRPLAAADGVERVQVERFKDRVRRHLPHHRSMDYVLDGGGPGTRQDYEAQLVRDVRAALTRDVESRLHAWDGDSEVTDGDVLHSHAVGRIFGFAGVPQATADELIVGRAKERAEIEAFLSGPDAGILTVIGAAGTGKTSLLAACASAARRHGEQVPGEGAVVVLRLLGTTPDASAVATLLPGLTRQIAASFGEVADIDVDASYPEAVLAFEKALRLAQPRRPIHLFVDAVDQLSPHGAAWSLGWIPDPLPPHVRIVLSVLPGSAAEGSIRRAAHVLELAGLSTSEGGRLLDTWLCRAGRTLTTPQRASVLEGFGRQGRPLWLRLAFEESRRWRSTDPPVTLPTSIPDLVRHVYARLSAPAERGAVLVAHVLGLLAASGAGLSEDELLDALSADQEVMKEARDRSVAEWRPDLDRFPVVLWAQLWSDLMAYLTERGIGRSTLLDFYHRELTEVAAQWRGGQPELLRRHGELSELFRRRADPDLDRSWTGEPRPLEQLPLQLGAGRRWEALTATLTDFGYLDRVCSTVRRQVVVTRSGREVRYAGASWIRRQIALTRQEEQVRSRTDDVDLLAALERALRMEAGVLSRNPRLFWQQVSNRLNREPTHAVRAVVARAAERRTAGEADPWLEEVVAPLEPRGLRQVLHAHDRAVCCAISPDGELVLSAGWDGIARLWDGGTGDWLADLTGHAGRVWCAFAGDSSLLLTVDERGHALLRRWDGIRPTFLAEQALPIGKATSVAVGDDALVATGSSGVVIVAARRLQHLRWLTDVDDAVCCAVSAQGELVVTGHRDGSLRSWIGEGSTASPRAHHRPAAHHGSVTCCAVDEHGRAVLTGGSEGVLRSWSFDLQPRGEDLVAPDLTNRTTVMASAVDRDMTRAVVALMPGVVQTWDMERREVISTASAHAGYVQAVALSRDGRLAASAALDGTVRLWDPTQPDDAGVEPFASQAQALAVTDRGDQVVSVDSYGMVRTWCLTGPASPETFETCTWYCRDAVVSGDGETVIVVDHDNGLEIWQRDPSPSRRHTLPFPTASTCVLSSTGIVVAGAPEGTIRAWDCVSGEQLWTRSLPGGNRVLTSDPAGQLVLSGSDSGTVALIDARTGQVTELLAGGDAVVCAAINGGLAVVGTVSGQVLRWTAVGDAWAATSSGPAHVGRVLDIVGSPGSLSVVSGGEDGRLGFWSASEQGSPTWIQAHEGGVRSLSVGTDGRLLVSTGGNKQARAWALAAGERIGVLPLAGDGQLVAVHPTANLIACCDSGSSVHVVRLVAGRRSIGQRNPAK